MNTEEHRKEHGTVCGQLRVFSLICVLLCSSVAAFSSAAEVIDRILAVVNGSMITLSEVHAARRFGIVATEGGGDPVQSALDALIDRRLMLIEVDRYGPPEPRPERIAAALESARARFPSAQAFDAALKESGLGVEELRRQLRDELRVESYLLQRFGQQRQPEIVREWVAGLRRRADVAILPR
jgi:hypothetical protein